ncbi:MAG TPA: hypothetical protein VHT27_04495 [Solirubrobacteraceae bacterium]|jgi:hypothetical protein|nr:hypothetical protein [Solirubrobacteraceae bacterium]
MPSATNAKRSKGIHDAWQPRGVVAALGASEAMWHSVGAQAEVQKAVAQLSKPLLGASMEKLFPTANLARQLTALQMPEMTKALGLGVGGSMGLAAQIKATEQASLHRRASVEKMFPTAELSRQLKALQTLDMTKALGVGGVASAGIAAQIKATQQASLHRHTALAGITEAQDKHLLAEMSRVGLHASSLSERLTASYDVTALTRSLAGNVASYSDRSLGVAALGAQALSSLAMPKLATQAFEESHRWFATIDRFSKRWEQSALWFMLSSLSIGHIHHMADMEPAEVEHDLLRALEAIVTGGEYAQALSSALDNAPHLTAVQRDHLQHGLEHAGRGEFERAIPPLMHGMEGALWSTARGLSVIDAKRRLINKPRMPRARSIEPVIRELPTGEGFSTFVIHRVFGGSGNVVRHGELGLDGRPRALFLVVAVAGWLDAVMDVPAHEVLGHMLGEQLSAHWRAEI